MSLSSAYVRKARKACLTLILVGLGSCGAESALLPEADLKPGVTARALVAPKPYPGGDYRKPIGPRGGAIRFGIGEVYFPPGAVQARTIITAMVDGRTVGVTLGPSGLTFPADAQPVLRFAVGPERGFANVLYVNSRDVILEVLEAQINKEGRLESRLAHFSKYIFGVE